MSEMEDAGVTAMQGLPLVSARKPEKAWQYLSCQISRNSLPVRYSRCVNIYSISSSVDNTVLLN